MGALSRNAILKRIQVRELVVSPILQDDQLGMSAVDLRMGNIVLMARARGLSHVDPRNYLKPADDHAMVAGKRQKHERHELAFHQRFLLHPGTLALVPTLEWVRLPMDLQGVVTARSTWAREGLSIATASFIEPGYEGIITLELANLGQIPIALYPGQRVAQLALYNVIEPLSADQRKKSQFHSAFEPSEGNIAKKDESFIPKE